MAKKLGNIIGGMEFSNAEKNRIADSLRSGKGAPHEMISTHASQIKDSEFWRRAQKKFRVTGFREGHPQAKQIVIRKILDSLKNEEGSENTDVWPLYRFTAYSFIKDELGNLNRLLYQEEVDETEVSTTEQIFRAIKRKIPIYDFSTDDVRKLYEIWGFDRIDNLEEILNDESLDIEVVRRLISTESTQLKHQITSEVEHVRTLLLDKIDASVAQMDEVLDDVKKLDKKISSATDILRIEFQNLAASLVNKKVSELQGNIKKSLEQVVPSVKHEVDPLVLEDFESRLDKMSKKIAQLDEKFNQNVKISTEGKASTRHGLGLNTTVGSLCKTWSEKIRGLGLPDRNLLAVPIIFQTLMRTKIIITYNPEIITELFSLSGAKIKSICASPLWRSPTDLQAEKNFLLSSEGSPGVLVISDFDVGLQEIYLLPFLIDWIQTSQSEWTKIILVPAHPNYSQVNSRLFEFSWCFNLQDDIFRSPKIKMDECINKFSKLPVFNSNSITICKYHFSTNLAFESDLAKISANEGVTLPSRLMNHFMNVLVGLSEVLPYEDSGNTAVAFCILPWVKSVRGEAGSRILEERFRIVFGGA